MKNFVADDEVLNLTVPAGGVVSGKAVLMGALLVVPHATAVEGAPFAARHRGVFELPKVSADVATQLQAAHWDHVNDLITVAADDGADPAVPFAKVGVFAEAAANAEAVANVLLTGQVA